MSRFLLACLASVAAFGPGAGDALSAPLTPAQRTDLDMLKRQLAEPDRTAKTKHEAAVMLLARSYPQAAELARQFLADKTNRPARVAVAEAISELGATAARQEFVVPLLEMLTGPDATLRVTAANALSAYKNHGVLDQLARLAK
ncbi:MAG: HEAT repeat domain-containing protein, partial [Planctomycetota bacterium]